MPEDVWLQSLQARPPGAAATLAAAAGGGSGCRSGGRAARPDDDRRVDGHTRGHAPDRGAEHVHDHGLHLLAAVGGAADAPARRSSRGSRRSASSRARSRTIGSRHGRSSSRVKATRRPDPGGAHEAAILDLSPAKLALILGAAARAARRGDLVHARSRRSRQGGRPLDRRSRRAVDSSPKLDRLARADERARRRRSTPSRRRCADARALPNVDRDAADRAAAEPDRDRGARRRSTRSRLQPPMSVLRLPGAADHDRADGRLLRRPGLPAAASQAGHAGRGTA